MIKPRSAPRVEWALITPHGERITVQPHQSVVGRRPARPAEMPTAQLVPLPDPEKILSKTHALIEVGAAGAWVTDLGSTNGTELIEAQGARECPAHERVALQPGARLRFGGLDFELITEETA